MADIVNLRRERKRKQRADNEAKASENRALHGRPAGQARLDARNRALRERRLEAHRREELPLADSDGSPE